MLKKKQSETGVSSLAVDRAWDEAAAHFKNIAAMIPSSFWVSGLSERTGANRLALLREKTRAQALKVVLDRLSPTELRQFQTLAFVNFEQASASLRINVISSISLPVGLLVFFNQIFPGELAALLEGATAVSAWIGLSTALAGLILNMWFCYAGVHQARDLYHLTLIESAARGVNAPAVGETEDDPEPDVSELY